MTSNDRGGSRATATSKVVCFVIIDNGWKLEAVNYYHKALHLECCSSPRSASGNENFSGDSITFHHVFAKLVLVEADLWLLQYPRWSTL